MVDIYNYWVQVSSTNKVLFESKGIPIDNLFSSEPIGPSLSAQIEHDIVVRLLDKGRDDYE